jgi:hypothetical protein
MNFKEWLLQSNEIIKESSNTSGKTGLYPLGYGGIGLFPPQWYVSRSADAIFYLSIDDRIYKVNDGKQFSIKHIPGDSSQNTNSKRLWKIDHIKGKPSHPVQKNYAAASGDKGLWKINHLKGNVTYKKNKEFIPDQGDNGGIWSINKLK